MSLEWMSSDRDKHQGAGGKRRARWRRCSRDSGSRFSTNVVGVATICSVEIMPVSSLHVLDADTERAARAFMGRVSQRYSVERAILFGSRARNTHAKDSDADIAVVLNGPRGQRSTAAIEMAGMAFDVLLETGILVEALPLWCGEMEHPEQFNNPALIYAIQRDGVAL
jgi:uncharacterized protein